MNNNLPQKYNDNIFNKVYRFIKNLFFRKNETLNKDISTIDDKEGNNKINNIDFIESVKIEMDSINSLNTEEEKYNFMENLKKNPSLLENFSSDRLEKILKYYLDENEKKRNILKKLTT